VVNCAIVKDGDGVDLQDGDFRRLCRCLASRPFASPAEDDPDTYPPQTDLFQAGQPRASLGHGSLAVGRRDALLLASYGG
jgi:hypothetical protein